MKVKSESEVAQSPLCFGLRPQGLCRVGTGELIPLRGLEGVPGLHGAPQDEAGLARKFDNKL